MTKYLAKYKTRQVPCETCSIRKRPFNHTHAFVARLSTPRNRFNAINRAVKDWGL